MTGTKQDAKVSQKSAIKIGKKAFLLSAGIILVLMLVSGILTIVLPSGEYQRVIQDGKTLVVNGTYHEVPKPNYPAWRWLTAPVEILFAQDNVALITIIIFIFCVGGSISILEGAGIMEELVKTLVQRFSKRKYLLIAVIIFFFMAISSFIGVYVRRNGPHDHLHCAARYLSWLGFAHRPGAKPFAARFRICFCRH
ncbi:MAG: hypothetical protein ACYC1H_10990 [Rectinema subterraneum]